MIASILFLTLVPLVPQGNSTLLPEAPAGWSAERLEFPLSFAPELEFEGVEELRFAPGMFAPDSDSYFSYVLALRLEGDVDVDEAFLGAFLEKYYRGLCRTVAEGRKLAFDPTKLAVEVRRQPKGFRASVAMIDPFVTGEPLELELELEGRSAPLCTELLGLASPMDAEAPIWTELRALGDRWRAARPPALLLNHVYVVPDRATFDALEASEFLRQFAVVEKRETVRGDASYTGLYLYGRRTYVEFLPPGAIGALVEGNSGLGLGIETVGGTDTLVGLLEARGIPTGTAAFTRRLGAEDLPWFRLFGVEMPSAPLVLFSMEYDPTFLARWNPHLPPARGGIERSAVLERYAASLNAGALREGAPFADISELRLALDDAQRERVLAVCRGVGYGVEAEGEEWVCHGPQLFRLRVQRSGQPGGVVGITMALREPMEHEPLQLGKARLTFDGGTANLRFEF